MGTKPYFHVNSSRENCIDHKHTTNMAALSRGGKPRIFLAYSWTYIK